MVVKYGEDYRGLRGEWVYEADLDSSPVLFAHDLGWSKNRSLLAYPGQTAWLLGDLRARRGSEIARRHQTYRSGEHS